MYRAARAAQFTGLGDRSLYLIDDQTVYDDNAVVAGLVFCVRRDVRFST